MSFVANDARWPEERREREPGLRARLGVRPLLATSTHATHRRRAGRSLLSALAADREAARARKRSRRRRHQHCRSRRGPATRSASGQTRSAAGTSISRATPTSRLARQARPPGRSRHRTSCRRPLRRPIRAKRVPQLKRSTAIAHAMQVHDDRRRRRLVSRHGSLSCSVAMCPRVPCGPLWQWLYRDANAGRLVVGGRDSRRQRARLR